MPFDLFNKIKDGSLDPSLLQFGLDEKYNQWLSLQDLINQVKAGTMNPNDIYAWASQNGYELTAEDEKFLDNAISSWNTQQSQQWQEDMRDTSITSTADQYEQIGLSGSNVLQGQVANTPNTMAADNSKTNLAQQKAERKLAMTQTVINLVKGLASAGIGGGALMAAKKLGAKSGLKAVSALGKTATPSAEEFARKHGYSSFAEMRRIAKTPWLDEY